MIKRILVVICLMFVFFVTSFVDAKQADLAGTWYSPSEEELSAELDGYMRNAKVEMPDGEVIGFIVPHAGFRFSGPVAAFTYKLIKEMSPDRIIVVGLTHRRYFPGVIAAFTDEVFSTPLGGAKIDLSLTNKLIEFNRNIRSKPVAFDSENSIEMQIPFIQRAAPQAKLVLLALCDQRGNNANALVRALYKVLKDEKKYVILASTDMSHYLSYEAAKKKDMRTIDLMKKFEPKKLFEENLRGANNLMCGYGAVYSVMSVCEMLGANEVEILNYANSGDTYGSKERVVGYLSAAFVKKAEGVGVMGQEVEKERGMFNQDQKARLLKIARDAIQYKLKTGKVPDVEVQDEVIKQDMGAFVTLRVERELRGCIGFMAARGPVYLTVRDMAIASATQDSRFSPVTMEEMKDIDIEISALSPMELIHDHNEIEVGKHGVMVKMGTLTGVYLPQVADETGWSKEEFMNSLCAGKAGIPRDAWKTGQCEIYIFTAEVFGEKDLNVGDE